MQTQQERLNTAHPEYQNASSLCDAVKTIVSTSKVYHFAGCYSIVKCEGINHTSRAKLVVRELRKIAKLPFKYDIPLKSSMNDVRARLKYSCSCKSYVPKTLSSLTSSSGRKSFSKPGAVPGNENVNTSDTNCGGIVIVTVRDDNSHPLGISGQQIIVEIIH
ncbi:hypothetical protein NP233_g2729 [Leucocoprinus birnbaumii]|uniref:Uncharacterized protein n=1 Tax=Leucocoprinus birnbaumii TaxID=56174 RepID=A0AAD5VXS2_9AGAR|nr:hypothetical protein NP233_g2729 [Leucocoprinus birnbaumii]